MCVCVCVLTLDVHTWVRLPLPAGQAVQKVELDSLVNRPEGHGRPLALVSPSLVNRPGTTPTAPRQAAAPVTGAYRPTGQGSHDTAPATPLKRPIAHDPLQLDVDRPVADP